MCWFLPYININLHRYTYVPYLLNVPPATHSNLQIQCNPYQTTNYIFHRIRTKNFTICMKHKRPQIAKTILRKKNGTGGINLPNFRTYYKAMSVKTVWNWHKNGNINQGNKTENPENPCPSGHLMFDKGGKSIQ